MTQNILEKIVELCGKGKSDPQTCLADIKSLASDNIDVLTQILDDYVQQNKSDRTDRMNRVKGAKRMLDM